MGVEKGRSEAIVMRSRRVTWREVMEGGDLRVCGCGVGRGAGGAVDGGGGGVFEHGWHLDGLGKQEG